MGLQPQPEPLTRAAAQADADTAALRGGLSPAALARELRGALSKVAQMAWTQKSGARGLRAILESALMDIMYEIPGQPASEVIVNEDVIEKHAQPLITYAKEAHAAEG